MLDAYIIDIIKRKEYEERIRREQDQPVLEYPPQETPEEDPPEIDHKDRGVVIIDLGSKLE